MNPEEFVGEGNFASYVGTYLGLARVPSLRAETATSSGAGRPVRGVRGGGGGSPSQRPRRRRREMTHLPTPRVSELIGRSIDSYERSYGAAMPALAGIVTRAWMTRTGATLRDISIVAVKNHANGARNPLAHFQETVTLETVLESRLVADPLRLYHCCPISDGAAAVVVRAEHAPIRIAGIGQGSDYLALRYRDDFTGFRATREAARTAFRMAGFGPERVEVAELHDAFTPFELISMEDTGLAPAGKAARMVAHGETALDGRLPVNPSGGLKARGHPLGATALAQVVELCWQLPGRRPGGKCRRASGSRSPSAGSPRRTG